MAQGSRLTETEIQAVASSLRHNPNWSAAADYAGVSDRVLRLYRERVETLETADKPLADLSAEDHFYQDAVTAWREARSAGEKELIDAIRQAIDKDWKAADSLLKKGWPDRYNERIEITGAGGGPVQIEQLKEEALARAEQAIEEIKKRDPVEKGVEVVDDSPPPPAGDDS